MSDGDSEETPRMVEVHGLVTWRVHGKVRAEDIEDGEVKIADVLEVVESEPVGDEPLTPLSSGAGEPTDGEEVENVGE